MGLFTPAWKSDDMYKRMTYLRRTKDMDRVREMALHDPVSYVRYEAVDRIDDKAFLLLSLKNEVENNPWDCSRIIEYLAKKSEVRKPSLLPTAAFKNLARTESETLWFTG